MNFDPSYDRAGDIPDLSDDEPEHTSEPQRGFDYFLYKELKDNQAENFDEYIKWHREHPHSLTPRKRRGNLDHAAAAGNLFELEDGRVYMLTGGAIPKETPPEFRPSNLGVNARMKEVNDVAHSREHQLRIDQRVDFDDPWWAYSVRDQASIHHVKEDGVVDDGSGYDPNDPRNFVATMDASTELEKRAADRERRRKEKQDALAISAYWGKPTRYNKSAKKRRLRRTQYSADGKEALGEYNAMEYEKEVEEALAEFHSKTSANSIGGLKGLSDEQVALETMITQFKDTLGGDDTVDKMGEGFIKLATKVRKQKDGHRSIFDGGLDFLDACVKVNATKAVPMLTFGADPNTVTEEEEPVLFMLICKVLVSDATRGDKKDNKGDKERRACMKILDALATHGANLDCYVGEEKESPLHKAAASGNEDVVLWLLKNGAKPNLHNPRTGASAMMMASKYAFPECVAHLIKYDAKVDMRDYDGRTALHYAADSGQSKMCKFLLRLGADRDIEDNVGRTPAELAVENVSMTVAQTISGFAPKERSVSEPLFYLNKKLDGNESGGLFGKLIGGIGNAIGGSFRALVNLFGGEDGKIGCWEALCDRFTDWYRSFQDMELKDWFKPRKERGVPVHPA